MVVNVSSLFACLRRPVPLACLMLAFPAAVVAQEFRPLGPLARPISGVATAPAVVTPLTPKKVGVQTAVVAQPDQIQTLVQTQAQAPVQQDGQATLQGGESQVWNGPVTEAYQTLDPDLWARIRRGFAMPELRNEWVSNQEQWYSSRPAYIGRMTERSSKYLYHIVEELERRGMPTELALLPFVESAFNPKAMSSAKAAGMWQFIPSTGRHFSLKQNLLRDDRRDVLASTKAALDYLQKLYGMFGDWHLALAAYNWGEGSVGRALAKNQRSELPSDYNSLSMPDETRNYVPKLQAIKNIVNNPTAFNAALPEIPNHPYFKSISLTKDMDVALAAKLAEMSVEEFRSLNPSANKPVIFAAGTPQILLPWDNVGIYERNLAIHNGQTAGWTVWTAPGVTKAADVARRFGMSEERFREINGIPPRMLIKAGSTLLVPRSASQRTEVSEQAADNATLSLAPEIVLVQRTVRLRRAESVSAVARRLKVSPVQLAGWNHVSPGATLKAKQTVVFFVPKTNPIAGKQGGNVGKGGKVGKIAHSAGKSKGRAMAAPTAKKKRH